MRVFLTGATGFIGRRLTLRLARDGHTVVAWTRNPIRARQRLGADPEIVDIDAGDEVLEQELARADAIVNLAGASIARRWTDRARKEIYGSRVDLTRRLVAALERVETRPEVLVSASAVGYYGDAGEMLLDEHSPAGEGFLPELCRAWEEAAMDAERLGIRVVVVRLAVVLGYDGGVLSALLPLFRAGLGAVVGSGRQFVPFVHVDDAVELFVRASTDTSMRGPFLAAAPENVRNRELTRTLGRVVHRPTLLRVPEFALRTVLGAASATVLDSQRTRPLRTLEQGFEFSYPDLHEALADAANAPAPIAIRAIERWPDVEYLREHPPRYLLEAKTQIDAPIEDVFAFFSRAENLGAITPSDMAFRIETPLPVQMQEGTSIRYRIQLGPVSMPWETRIDVWEPGARFVDAQVRGPYASWYHEHSFEAMGERTRMSDRVFYAPPLGPVGTLANRWFVASQLQRIFGYRAKAIALRFGARPEPVAVAA